MLAICVDEAVYGDRCAALVILLPNSAHEAHVCNMRFNMCLDIALFRVGVLHVPITCAKHMCTLKQGVLHFCQPRLAADLPNDEEVSSKTPLTKASRKYKVPLTTCC